MSKVDTDEHYPPAMMQNGEPYTGNQMFQGMGVAKWCAKCQTHRSVGGGQIIPILGGRHWVCSMHPKKVKS